MQRPCSDSRGFLLRNYLQQQNLDKFIPLLNIEKESGIPVISDFLLAVNLAIIGKPRFGQLKRIKGLGLATASGFPSYPDQSHLSRFLGLPKMECVNDFIKAVGSNQYEITI